MTLSTLEQKKNTNGSQQSRFLYFFSPLTVGSKWHKMGVNGEKWEIRLGRMFIGEFHHTLDDKGRLAIPVKFRAQLAEGAVVTRGLDRSLFLYPKADWEKLASKIAALPIGQADTRAFARLMLAGAMDVEVDKSGRVTVPEYLREYASLSKNAVITGLYDRLEIWDENSWNEYSTKTEAAGNDIAERLGSVI